MAVTLTQLSAFVAVVKRGSVTAAADELVVTQPSVSAAIIALEREVGTDLTERSGRRVVPTPAGVAYARYAETVLGLLRDGRTAANSIAVGEQSELRIAAVNTAGEGFVPALVSAFRDRNPALELSLFVGNRDEVFGRLGAHTADIAISGWAPDDPDLAATEFAANEMVLITAPADPMAERSSVSLRDLGECRWLLREEGSGTRRVSEGFLQSHRLNPVLLTMGSNGAVKSAARAGLGVSLLSRESVRLELELGLLATIRPRGGLVAERWFAVRSKLAPVRAAVDDFIEFLGSSEATKALLDAHSEDLRRSRRGLSSRAPSARGQNRSPRGQKPGSRAPAKGRGSG